jgi:hypothetical protein
LKYIHGEIEAHSACLQGPRRAQSAVRSQSALSAPTRTCCTSNKQAARALSRDRCAGHTNDNSDTVVIRTEPLVIRTTTFRTSGDRERHPRSEPTTCVAQTEHHRCTWSSCRGTTGEGHVALASTDKQSACHARHVKSASVRAAPSANRLLTLANCPSRWE